MRSNSSDDAAAYTEAQIEDITDELQCIVDRRHSNDIYQHWTIEHRIEDNEDGCDPGWYAMPEESRGFYDFGEYLGHTRDIAVREINLLMDEQN